MSDPSQVYAATIDHGQIIKIEFRRQLICSIQKYSVQVIDLAVPSSDNKLQTTGKSYSLWSHDTVYKHCKS